MLFLVIAICASVLVSVLLKAIRNTNIEIPQVVFWNYIVATLLAYFTLAQPQVNLQSFILGDSWYLFILLGILFPSVFIFMGKAVQTSGVARADTANRLSLVFGIIASFAIFGQQATAFTFIGIALAFIAIFMLLNKYKEKTGLSLSSRVPQKSSWGWLLLVWVGYGVIDILLKLMAVKDIMSLLIAIFILAAVIMLGYLLVRRTNFNLGSIIIGVILGALNFTNIVFYIKAHQVLHTQTALVFTTMNIGVIILSIILGVFFFKERLTKLNFWGMVIALIAIACLAYNQVLNQYWQSLFA
ncbi:DMT family transporter [Psittacicella gerlachiana]|uniref:EamA domain-containing protein n=1 Tax=Psittacicella gerlachiana TaxID=2028574 RepID=A0A3A1Y3W2_9GAMM|nr:DMT family transporter [Psittacicella gerlachiana]RIY31989.1 hypothetical protein CKF59_07235 [Psittacicella gerlachiana]